jgi:hypothetical protein
VHDEGEDAFVMATRPLRVPDSRGELTPVDITLDEVADGWQPKNPLEPYAISDKQPGQVAFTRAGVTITPASVPAQAAGVRAGETVLFGATQPDTDTIIKPGTEGVQYAWQLRSPQSPEQLVLRLDLPSGAVLSSGKAGDVAVTKDDKVLVRIAPVMAFGADGEPVSTSMRVDGDSVSINVAHRDEDVAYPIIVDPEVVAGFYFPYQGLDAFGYWQTYNHSGGKMALVGGDHNYGRGLYVQSSPYPMEPVPTPFNPGSGPADADRAGWYFNAPGQARIYKVYNTLSMHILGTSLHTCMYVGIAQPGISGWDGPNGLTFGEGCAPFASYPWTSEVPGGIGNGTPGNAFVFSDYSYSVNSSQFNSYFRDAEIRMTDSDFPGISSFGVTDAWTNDPATPMYILAGDASTGVRTINVSGPSGWSQAGAYTNPNCLYGPCTPQLSQTRTIGDMPEGAYTLTATAIDAAGNPSTGLSRTVRFDHTAPTLALSGTLKNSDGLTISPGTYGLHVATTDQAVGSPRAGMGRIQVDVDGSPVAATDQTCPASSCSLDYDWNFDTTLYTGGPHTINVSATDLAGNTSTSSITVDTNCCMLPLDQWGNTDPSNDIRWGDVNGDGIDDAVIRDSNGDVYVGVSFGDSFDYPHYWGFWSDVRDFHVTDVNDDGMADVAGRNQFTGSVQVGLSDGTEFATSTEWASIGATGELSFANVDGLDGDDLLLTNTSGAVQVGYSTTTAFETLAALGSATAARTAGDVDADGMAELISYNATTGALTGKLSDQTSLIDDGSWGTWGSGYQPLIADVNADGKDDLIGRTDATNTIRYASSNGTTFGAPAVFGTVPASYATWAADVTGDGLSDIIAVDPATGNVYVGASIAPYPDEDATDDFTADPGLDYSDAVAQAAANTPSMQLLVQDDAVFMPATIDSTTDLMYDRARQLGASRIRFNAEWGKLEDQSGGYHLTRLVNAVTKAKDEGFDVYVTLMGASLNAFDCNAGLGYPARGCLSPHTGQLPADATAMNTRAEQYGNFVQAVVGALRPLGVTDYGVWNEPNTRGFLTRGASRGDFERVTDGYRRLYREAYSRLKDNNVCVGGGCKVYFGELSELVRPGRTTTLNFIAQVVGEGDPIITDGIAIHPYQHRTPPKRRESYPNKGSREPKPVYGIGRVDAMRTYISGRVAAGRLRTPASATRVPGLYATEFGYFNRDARRPLDLTVFHSEAQRALWWNDALQRAKNQKLKWFTAYQLTEKTPANTYAPNPNQPLNTITVSNCGGTNGVPSWDSGLIGADGAVTGTRCYGKGSTAAVNNRYVHPQLRAAYCSILRWANRNHYATDPSVCG